MTHAFFKALLFMAAGSIIGAMAGASTSTRCAASARRCRSPALLLAIGALSLARAPRLPGFFSKDEILVFAATRGGMYWTFAIGGYLGAFLTAFYAFRITFRVVDGEPVRGGEGARGGPPRPRRARQPGHRRGGGHRRRLPRPRPLHRRARDGR